MLHDRGRARARRRLFTGLALGALSGLAALASGACSGDDPATGPAGDAGSAQDGTTPATPSDALAPTDAPSGGDAALDASAGDGSSGDAGPDATTTADVALVYAGRFNNLDQRLVKATFGSDGRILGYVAGPPEAPFVTTASVDGVFSDGFAGASRWTAGEITGAFYDDGGVKTIPAQDGQHLGIAKVPSVELPATGATTYTLASATRPTLANGATAEGTVTSGALTAVLAGNAGTVVGFTLVLTMGDGTFVVRGNGGAEAPAGAAGTGGGDAGYRFASPTVAVDTDAGTCAPDAGPCPSSGGARVVFSGPNAERVVVAYVINAGSIATARRGVAVFQR